VAKLGLTLDNALDTYRRLAFMHPGPSFVAAEGELRPLEEWPKATRDFVLHGLSLQRQTSFLSKWKKPTT
jgi:hypothetical protein